MRYLLRAFFTGSSALGLAMVVGCGAASDHSAYDDAGEFHVPRSIASAEPERLVADDRLAIDIAYADDCSRLTNEEASVAPVGAREALPRSVFVVQPAEPVAVEAQPIEATPIAKLVLPPTDRGVDLQSPGIEPAPAPSEAVGSWTPPVVDAAAKQESPVMRIPPAPRDWDVEQRLADARGWAAPQLSESAHARRVPVIAAAPLVVAALEPTMVAPQPAIEAEAAPSDVPSLAIEAEPPAAVELAEPVVAPPVAPIEVPEPVYEQDPVQEPIEVSEQTPLNPILLTPESDGPDSHWPSTLVPLPPIERGQELAPEPPLPNEASAPVLPPAESDVPPPVTAPPARELGSAPLARPIPGLAPQRTAEMEAVSRLAFARVQGGFVLAQRGALFAARSEFIGAMRLLAQAKDTEQHTNRHSQALAAGLRAIEEADSLLPSGSQLEADLDLHTAIAGHRTPVLHGTDASNMTVTAALQHYYTYAQEQLALSGDGEPVASMALYGLGKIHAALARQPSTNVKAAEPKSMIFHQAALLIDGRNYLAANDLGVLLVRLGRLPDAREAFLHSLSHQSQAHTWNNLSAVHRQLGETQLAEQAHQRGEQLAQQGRKAVASGTAVDEPNAVTWVDPSEFAAGTPQTAQRPSPAEAERLKPIPEPKATPMLERILPWTANKNTNSRK